MVFNFYVSYGTNVVNFYISSSCNVFNVHVIHHIFNNWMKNVLVCTRINFVRYCVNILGILFLPVDINLRKSH